MSLLIMIQMLYPLSVIYNPKFNCIEIKLYNSKNQRIESYFDTSFLAYCISRQRISVDGIKRQTQIQKYDALQDKDINLWKVEFLNPQFVRKTHKLEGVWENHVKFFQSYVYDSPTSLGMPYEREKGMLVFQVDYEAEARVRDLIKLINPPESDVKITEDLARLLEYPAPQLVRTSLDIEVMNEKGSNAIPNPEVANLPILCICFTTTNGEKIALMLVQEGKPVEIMADATQILFFSSEKELIETAFKIMNSFPFVITFNGDDFDLRYMFTRALRLGIPEDRIPIYFEKRFAMLKNSIHIDLYRFFSIKAMRIYAFAEKYKNNDLDTVGKALIGEGKLKGEKQWVSDMSYTELANYCLKDAEITLRLTTYDNDLVIKLMLVLCRLSQTPIENVTRKSISNWIRNMIFREHRKRNMLIPNPEDIKSIKGQLASAATIKGKKYRGAIVVNPQAGFHFKTDVGDFASLYPSIIKVHNLGYATVLCPHGECKKNTFGELPHWICTKNRAVESQLIGALRDLRVTWYKKKAKDKENPMKEWYSVAEQSIKVICNASYGVFGSDEFALYCPPFAEEVTAIGRYDITKTIERAQQIGLTVLYGDTDSIFLKNPPKEKIEELIKWTKNEFDIDFEIDKNYRYVCLSERKKNYFGVLQDGKVDVKGLTGKKKHTPKIFKDTFENVKDVLSKVYNDDDARNAKFQITKMVKGLYHQFKERNFTDLHELAFNVTINKEITEYGKQVEYFDEESQTMQKKRTEKGIPQHIRAARQLIAKDYPVQIGSTISYLKVLGKPNVKPLELAKKEEIDVSKYIEFMRSMFIQVLEPLNVDWDRDILGICSITDWTKSD